MATRRPLVVVNGTTQEIPAGDTLDASTVPAGGGGGTQQVFVQASAPVAAAPYIWIQTGLPNDGFTFWFEDGL
jgi:hypothetical protein